MDPIPSLTRAFPPELIVLLFCNIASYPLDPDEGPRENHTILLPLAKTCWLCYKLFNESRSAWTALFRTSFDLHPHHTDSSHNIREEYKCRFRMLNDIHRWRLRGNRCPTRHVHVELLETLAFEHKKHNFMHFKRSPGVPSFLRREFLSIFKLLRSIQSDPVAQTRTSLAHTRKWLAIFAAAMISDRGVAKCLISFSWSDYRRPSLDPVNLQIDAVFRNPDTLLTIENAQRAQIAILQTLCSLEPTSVEPFPRFTSSWVDLLEMDKSGVTLRPAQMPLPQSLCGRWAGYFTRHFSNLGSLFSFTLAAESYPSIYCTLSATNGEDDAGTFVLSGRISSDGSVLIKKLATGTNIEEEVVLKGFILPWGIAGNYENGLFWIWKVPEKHLGCQVVID